MQIAQFRRWLVAACLTLSLSVHAAGYTKIIIPAGCHPAVQSAAQILAQKLSLPDSAIETNASPGAPNAGEIILTVVPADWLTSSAQATFVGDAPSQIQRDGYVIVFQNGGAMICGARPRSLLYAAGDFALWQDHASGTYVRNPDFAVRTAPYYDSRSVADYVATMGVNNIIGSTGGAGITVTFKDTLPEVYAQLSPEQQQYMDERSERSEREAAAFAQECHDADVDYYPFLYGNNFAEWSPALYDAVLKVYPSVYGSANTDSWEKATLCPSDPNTWKVIDAYVKEFVQKSHGDGLYATFWDHYGIFCQDDRCKADGMDQFSNELYECIKQYHDTLAPLGKKLIVRTWASGEPHWLNGQWVHAPGYGNFGSEGTDVWGRVINELPADITLQTKVYNSDCQPDPPFSPLLGQEKPHTEIAEYQITGQTTGRLYFPASTVNHTDWTIKKSLDLLGHDGGVSLFPGATGQSDYSGFDDILNSINFYAWRQLSWDVNADTNQIWMDWAVPIYGVKAAPHIVKALQLSEDVVNHLFSTLGMGSSTESTFVGTIAAREVNLKYSNRYYEPEGAKYLEPTTNNIQAVIDEKNQCLAQIDEMFQELDLAKPDLTPAQADELATRFDWLRQFAIVNANLEESLWRYRYLRYEASMLTTDPEQLKYIAESYDVVQAHRRLLFQSKSDQKFSCYDVSMGDLNRYPSLGNPMSLMRDIYQESEAFIKAEAGPDVIQKDWVR
jgi:hypothetical protein